MIFLSESNRNGGEMKAFEDYRIKAEIETIGYLTASGAFDAGREIGWRAALEWARTQATDIQTTELDDAIRKELEDK